MRTRGTAAADDQLTASNDGALAYYQVRVAPSISATFAVDPRSDDPIGRWIATHGYPHEPPNQLFQQLLRPDARVIDIGAHLGTFALAASAHGCDVIAVEGSPTNVALLEAARARSGFERLRIVNAAADDHPGFVRFNPHLAWGHIAVNDEPGGQFGQVELPAVTVDELVKEQAWDAVDVVKIDVEGAELRVLRGMSSALHTDPAPAIIIEINDFALRRNSTSGAEVKGFLEDNGYRLYMVDRTLPGRLIPTAAHDVPVDVVADFLAVKSLDESALGAWYVGEPLSEEETIARLWDVVTCDHPPFRAHVALFLSEAPPWLRASTAWSEMLQRLAGDPDAGVREAASSAVVGSDSPLPGPPAR